MKDQLNLKNVFGIFKIFFGLTFTTFQFITFFKIHLSTNNIYLLLGIIAAALCSLSYGIYLIFSGWQLLRNRTIYNRIRTATALIINIIIILSVTSLFLEDRFKSSRVVRIIVILSLISFGIYDAYKLVKEKHV